MNRRLMFICCLLLTCLLVAPALAQSGQMGNAEEVFVAPPELPIGPSSTHNPDTVYFAREFNKTSIILRVCSTGPHFQLRSEHIGSWMTEIFYRTQTAGGCSPSTTSGWRMVFNIDTPTNAVFRIYVTAYERQLSESEFMERARRYLCRPSGYGTGSCSEEIVSAPQADINQPGREATVQGKVNVVGWSVDRASPSGPGVDLVHLYAGDRFLGEASYGHARADVTALLGDSRFANSGFSFALDTSTLPNGATTLRVASRNSRTGSWSFFDQAIRVENPAQPADTIPPDGRITAPAEGTRIGTAVDISADAWDNAGGSGVARVEFFVGYDGAWHPLGSDTSAPYGTRWQVPPGLRTQTVLLTIHVIDNAGNRRMDPGGYRRVAFIEPNVSQGWVANANQIYLNQNALGITPIAHQLVSADKRSLLPQSITINHPGNIKCSAASMAMALAANGYIGADFASLRDKANAMYPQVLQYLRTGDVYVVGSQGEGVKAAYIWKQRAELQQQGASASREVNGSLDYKWNVIKSEIAAGRPVILGVGTTNAGHLLLVVGWREEGGTRSIIVNDPYGKWLGGARYDVNQFNNPNSAKGRWQTYNFSAVRPGWMITTSPIKGRPALADDSLDALPGEISIGEPEEIVEAEGIEIANEFQALLPSIRVP